MEILTFIHQVVPEAQPILELGVSKKKNQLVHDFICFHSLISISSVIHWSKSGLFWMHHFHGMVHFHSQEDMTEGCAIKKINYSLKVTPALFQCMLYVSSHNDLGITILYFIYILVWNFMNAVGILINSHTFIIYNNIMIDCDIMFFIMV